MNFLLYPLQRLFDVAHAAKGQCTLTRLIKPQMPNDCYQVVISDGSVIVIFCSEIVYSVSYAAWWALSKRILIYSVYCTCSANTSQALKDKFSREFKITNLSHPLASVEARKKAAIDAYVDTIIQDV